ncbi:hypothetical protein BGZ94_001011 [Podila epigama]|nr:hypothetical protein BGZ94_001011 [Podila epigama]
MIDRCGLAGSPFLPASRDDAYDAMMNMALSLAVTRGAGHQGVKGQSRVGGDGGNGNGHDSEISTGVSKGDEDEDNDEDCDDSAPCPREPSSYTFRRRNAIVEWSEDAPKPNAYSSFCSSSSE